MMKIRKATPEDAEFIARGFMMAVWMTEEEMERMLPICRELVVMDDSLYSWRNARIAVCDGKNAGVCISYDGKDYRRRAEKSFAYVLEQGGEDFTQMEQEAVEGEWYIDTLAVWPKFRRQGVARLLLQDAILRGKESKGVKKITLAVDPDHPWVVNLYRSVGFRDAEEVFIFGQTYRKMEC